MMQEFSAKLKEKVLIAERSLLYVIGFEFQVEHPTQLALDFLQRGHTTMLPTELHVSPQEWADQCQAQQGAAFDVMNQLSVVAWDLCMARRAPRKLTRCTCVA